VGIDTTLISCRVDLGDNLMEFLSFDNGSLPVSVNISCFRGQDGVTEHHLTVHPVEYASLDIQLEWVFKAYRDALDHLGLHIETAVLRRFFCSDLPNQFPILKNQPFSNPQHTEPCAVSLVCQPPGPSAKVSLWAYHVSDQNGNRPILPGGSPAHYWTTGLTCPVAGGSCDQTRGILEKYDAFLKSHGMSLADNVIRTWFFVQNIDANYHGLVAARKEFFAEHGLTADTHFIASTGIEGGHADIAATVTMDAYAVSGIRPAQISYLTAPDHLSPTHIYGVTFERGTAVTYRDRRHVIISGTASIDSQGKILHHGDALRQLDRAIENVEALLAPAGAGLEDMAAIIVYVRDISDHTPILHKMRQRFGDIPMTVVCASVCRPGWLVELEGMAIVPASCPELPVF